jgi:uroporphyrinogen-III synthase
MDRQRRRAGSAGRRDPSSGHVSTRVIVTRPAADAAAWVEPLRAAGFVVDALPLIEIVAAAAPGTVAASRSLDAYDACFFVSGNAVTFFFASNHVQAYTNSAPVAIKKGLSSASDVNSTSGAMLHLPPTLRCMAPGPGTAKALIEAGVDPAQIDTPPLEAGQFDSQTLWQQLATRNWHGQRVLIVRGDSPPAKATPNRPARADDDIGAPGRDWIARQWTLAGAHVDFVVVYQRQVPHWSAAQLARARAASADGSVWLFSSSEAVDNLLGLPAMAGVGWRAARAVATHPRIVERVRAAGWGVVTVSRPTLADITASIESARHE